jgi:hypothetical protein
VIADDGKTEAARRLRGGMTSTLRLYRSNSRAAVSPRRDSAPADTALHSQPDPYRRAAQAAERRHRGGSRYPRLRPPADVEPGKTGQVYSPKLPRPATGFCRRAPPTRAAPARSRSEAGTAYRPTPRAGRTPAAAPSRPSPERSEPLRLPRSGPISRTADCPLSRAAISHDVF